jgi:hypothetical protein
MNLASSIGKCVMAKLLELDQTEDKALQHLVSIALTDHPVPEKRQMKNVDQHSPARLSGVSPPANYNDRGTSACRRSLGRYSSRDRRLSAELMPYFSMFTGFRLTQLCFNNCLLYYSNYALHISAVRPSSGGNIYKYIGN